MSGPPRKPWWRRWFGSRAERAAARFLRRLGFRILQRNYTCPVGEIDIVALEGRTIVFVEVRSTAGTSSDRPAESVDLRKQERLTNLALHFLSSHRLLGQSARFDVVIVHWPAGQREPTLTHHRQAFEAVGRHQMFN